MRQSSKSAGIPIHHSSFVIRNEFTDIAERYASEDIRKILRETGRESNS